MVLSRDENEIKILLINRRDPSQVPWNGRAVLTRVCEIESDPREHVDKIGEKDDKGKTFIVREKANVSSRYIFASISKKGIRAE